MCRVWLRKQLKGVPRTSALLPARPPLADFRFFVKAKQATMMPMVLLVWGQGRGFGPVSTFNRVPLLIYEAAATTATTAAMGRSSRSISGDDDGTRRR